MNTMQIIFKIIYCAVFILAIYFSFRRYWDVEEVIEIKEVKLEKKTIFIIIATVFASRIVLLLLSWGATHLFGNGRELLDTWNHWDANQYIAIADQGYYSSDEGWIRLVFFPLYSAVIWLFNLVFSDGRISAMLTSWICLSTACVYLYKLVLLDYDKSAAKRAVKFLLIFPVTVFLGAPFTESMFLFLSLACLYYARIRKYAFACFLGGLAALTRNVGILLVVPVMVEILLKHKLVPKLIKDNTKNKVIGFAKEAKYLLLIPMGTLIYLLINHLITGDVFYFLKMQQGHWSQSFGSYSNTLKVTLEQILSPDNILRNKLTLWISQFVVLLIGGLTLPIICKKFRISYGLYATVYLFVVFAPTWLLSGFRYYMGLCILYPAIAMLAKRKWVNIVMTITFLILLPLYTYCFSVQWQVI